MASEKHNSLGGMLSLVGHALQEREYNEHIAEARDMQMLARLFKDGSEEERKRMWDTMREDWDNMDLGYPFPGEEEITERMEYFTREDFHPAKVADGKIWTATLFNKAGEGCYRVFDCCEHVFAALVKTINNAEAILAKRRGKLH